MSLIAVVPSPFRESHTASGAFLSLCVIHTVHASPCACKPGSVLELFPLHLLNLKPQAAPFSHSEAQFVQSNLMVGRGKKKKKIKYSGWRKLLGELESCSGASGCDCGNNYGLHYPPWWSSTEGEHWGGWKAHHELCRCTAGLNPVMTFILSAFWMQHFVQNCVRNCGLSLSSESKDICLV